MNKNLAIIKVITLLMMVLLTACQSDHAENVERDTWFVDEAEVRGLDFVFHSGYQQHPYLPEITGGGVALVDVDADDDLDVYFIQGGWNLADKEAMDSPNPYANQLYLNDGTAHFTQANLIGDAAHKGYGMGAATGDYDNDGDMDIYVTNYGENVLLQNDGTGSFKDVTEAAGVGDLRWSTAASFIDIDLDNDLDLFVVNYLNWSVASELNCFERGAPTYCLPTNYKAPSRDSLFLNNGDGTFTDISITAGLHKAFGNGLGLVTADYNKDGLFDFFVANDTMVNQLWLNQGDNKFKDAAFEWGCAVDNHGIEKAGMGVDTADIDDDMDFDVVVVNLRSQSDSVFMNQKTFFRDETSRVGLGTGSRRFTRFGAVLADFDNNGLLDLMEASGKVDGDPNSAEDMFAQSNILFRGVVREQQFRFEELVTTDGTAINQIHTSRALARGDLNNDGRLDVVIVNRDAPAYLLMNIQETQNNWLQLRVLNRFGSDALGATVTARVGGARKLRVVKTAGSYLSALDPRVHFGLGTEEEATNVLVLWPTGEQTRFDVLAANQLVEVRFPN